MDEKGWECACRHRNEPEFTLCLLCGRPRQVGQTGAPGSHLPAPVQADLSSWLQRKETPKWSLVVQFKDLLFRSELNRVSWDTPLRKRSRPAQAAGGMAPEELDQVIEAFITGDEEAAFIATERLRHRRPPEAVTPLLQIASGERTSEDARRAAAIEALGTMGDRSVAQELLRLKDGCSGDLKFFIISALGEIGDPLASEWLLTFQKEVLPLKESGFFFKSLALLALGKIGDPSVMAQLAEDAATDHFEEPKIEAEEEGEGALMGMVRMGFNVYLKSKMKSMSLHNYALAVTQVFSATVLADTDLTVSARQTWLYRLRLWLIANICHSSSTTDRLPRLYKEGGNFLHGLLLAIPGLAVDKVNRDEWLKVVTGACQKGSSIEKVLAYDALIRLGYYQYAAAGFSDKDPNAAIATAASAISCRAEPLLPAAFRLAVSEDADFRMGLAPGIMALWRLHNDPRATSIAQALLKDRDKTVADQANSHMEFFNNLELKEKKARHQQALAADIRADILAGEHKTWSRFNQEG